MFPCPKTIEATGPDSSRYPAGNYRIQQTVILVYVDIEIFIDRNFENLNPTSQSRRVHIRPAKAKRGTLKAEILTGRNSCVYISGIMNRVLQFPRPRLQHEKALKTLNMDVRQPSAAPTPYFVLLSPKLFHRQSTRE
ncbi:hypothetical protein EVAR_54947_1 [Eumeta japonica]|uniref:Uncharacterized protein n=1 Tax=Eumeta variegata TaxID=151549 RepID=A0A4C1YII2_EUMVA|nr:hypothetical protein EVAR_54947_1 [Eumeta japonica]